MLLTFTQWYRWQDMLAMAALVVESREAGDEPALQAAAADLTAQGGRGLFARNNGRRFCRRRHCAWCRKTTYTAQKKRFDTMTCEEAKKIVKPRLSEKRWTHTKNVKKMAVKLAKQWGADPEKAAVAAILHDSAKELPKSELLQIFADNAIIAENAPARPSPVWHGIAAAILAETQWGVTDPEILSAIRCHTTGKLNMTKLDKIIYLADMTSAERDWPGVEDLRKLEMQDLDRALCDALKRSIDFVEEKGGTLDPESVAAYEYAKEHLQEP